LDGIGLGGGSLGILVVALAPSIAAVLVGWCLAQLLFNALLAAMVAVLPDQVPAAQRGQPGRKMRMASDV
jgi:MFS family permease